MQCGSFVQSMWAVSWSCCCANSRELVTFLSVAAPCRNKPFLVFFDISRCLTALSPSEIANFIETRSFDASALFSCPTQQVSTQRRGRGCREHRHKCYMACDDVRPKGLNRITLNEGEGRGGALHTCTGCICIGDMQCGRPPIRTLYCPLDILYALV